MHGISVHGGSVCEMRCSARLRYGMRCACADARCTRLAGCKARSAALSGHCGLFPMQRQRSILVAEPKAGCMWAQVHVRTSASAVQWASSRGSPALPKQPRMGAQWVYGWGLRTKAGAASFWTFEDVQAWECVRGPLLLY